MHDRDRPLEHPVHHHFRASKCAVIMPSTPSSRRQTTSCLLCIESDGIVCNFNARQHEVTDTSSEDLAAAGVDDATALLDLNRLFVAWVETEYHRRVHTETGQSPLARWDAGCDRLGRTPAMPTADELTEAFLWSEYRVVTKTATVSLHANTYQVDAALVGRRVELVFPPFDLETVEPATATRVSAKRCRTPSSATPTPKPGPRTPSPSRRRRPGSTTWR